MRRVRQAIYESSVPNPQKVIELVEDVIADALIELDNEASILTEKHDGASELTHYYAGKGMNLRDVADKLGVIVNWEPLTARREYYEGD